ncbi:MAG: undecaprenyl-diphosphate phosphatase [Promethearchaeia archaeon]
MIEYIIIAILQGLIESLPISSSGQVMIISMEFFDIPPQDAFSLAIFLHLGTIIAILLKFYQEFLNMIKSFIPQKFDVEEIDIKNRNWLIFAAIGTAVVAVPVYFLFKVHVIEEFTALSGDLITLIISGLLIITGIILLNIKKKYGIKQIGSMEQNEITKDSFLAGLFQGFSVLSGISRSGITVSSILLNDYKEDNALKLSFLMSVPAVLGSIGIEILFNEQSIVGSLDIFLLLSLTLISAIFGYISIDLLLKLAKKMKFTYFCIIYGMFPFAVIVPFMLGTT